MASNKVRNVLVRSGIALSMLAGTLVALTTIAPGALAGEATPPPTNGYVRYLTPIATLACTAGTPTSVTFKFFHDATDLDTGYNLSVKGLASDQDGITTPIGGDQTIAMTPGTWATYQHTFALTALPVGASTVDVFATSTQTDYWYVSASVSLACPVTVSRELIPPRVVLAGVTCSGDATVIFDGTDSNTSWTWTIFPTTGGFAPGNQVIAPGQTVTYPVTGAHASDVYEVKFSSPEGSIDVGKYSFGTECPLQPTALTISASATIKYGAQKVIATHLTNATTHAGMSGRTVNLYSRTGTSGLFALVASRRTDSAGAASATVQPTTARYYRWRYAGNATVEPAGSAISKVSVAPVVTVHASPTSARANKPLTLWGTVTPSPTGQYVYLQSKPSSASTAWTTTSVKAVINSQKMPDGVTRVGYLIKFTPHGHYYRTYRPASVRPAGASPTVHAI
jgi:hypothetical protein